MNDDCAAEVDADVRVGLAVDRERRRHLDVGVVEVGQLLLPVVVLELQEDRPQRARVVEGRIRGRSSRRPASPWARVRGRHASAPEAAGAAPTRRSRAPGSAASDSRAACAPRVERRRRSCRTARRASFLDASEAARPAPTGRPCRKPGSACGPCVARGRHGRSCAAGDCSTQRTNPRSTAAHVSKARRRICDERLIHREPSSASVLVESRLSVTLCTPSIRLSADTRFRGRLLVRSAAR